MLSWTASPWKFNNLDIYPSGKWCDFCRIAILCGMWTQRNDKLFNLIWGRYFEFFCTVARLPKNVKMYIPIFAVCTISFHWFCLDVLIPKINRLKFLCRCETTTIRADPPSLNRSPANLHLSSQLNRTVFLSWSTKTSENRIHSQGQAYWIPSTVSLSLFYFYIVRPQCSVCIFLLAHSLQVSLFN